MSFSFGTPSSAPATSSLSGGFNFGAAKPATPAFGLGTSQTSTGLFGTPATTAPTFGNTSFGTASAFGSTSTAPTFGATSTSSFGANTGTLSFGAPSNAPAFGATSVAPTFGAPAAAPAFGTATTPAFGATTTPAFGTGTPAFGTGTGLGSSGLSFGTTTAPTGLSFGTPATSAPTLGGLGGFGFGATTTTQTTGFGLFPSTATTTNSLFGTKLGTTNTIGTQPLVTPSLGLGGVTTTGVATSTTADGKTEPPKQTKLPNEILTNVNTFKEFVKKQKSLSTDIMRTSIKPLHKVSAEAEACSVVALHVGAEVSRARAASRRLRAAAAAALAAALHAADAAHGSDLEGEAPPAYIKELISELEQQLITFRRQMDAADKQMQASPKLLTEQELTMGIRRMHEALVALAGRLQAVHAQVEAQKEQYLNLRKYVLKDPTNVFETTATSNSLDQILRDAEGTRKKNKSLHDTSVSSAVLSDPKAALGNIHQLAGPTPFSYLGTSFSPFPSVEAAGASWQPQQLQSNFNTSLNATGFGASGVETSFQLQKPPGKRTKQ